MAKRLTISMDDVLELVIKEAPQRLGLPRTSSRAERLRAWAVLGYEKLLEEELDRERLETYKEWTDDPEIGEFSEAALRAAAKAGLFRDD